MSTFFLSDLHFGHAKILDYEPRRVKILGSTIQEHDEALIRRINSMVKPTDTLYMLGDIGLEEYEYLANIIPRVNGRKILILGNHDRLPVAKYGRLGFVAVFYEAKIKIGKTYVLLAHHPYRIPWYKCLLRRVPKDNHARPFDRGGFLIHGHIHSGKHHSLHNVRGRQIHVGVDANNYYPVQLEKIASIIDDIKKTNKKDGLWKILKQKKSLIAALAKLILKPLMRRLRKQS